MSLGTDILRLLVQADASGAVKEFQKLGRGIEDTGDKAATGFKGKLTQAFDGLQAKSSTVSGIFDKIGLSSQQAAGAIATTIPFAAAAAGGAIAAFAAKGVSDFQHIALEAGKFADASGLSVQEASKWIEVADHIGVSSQAVSSAFRRMDVAIGNNSKGFQELGVQVAKNRDGSANLTETFLRVATALQGIEDPTKRAAAAQKLFGKGYAEVAELIGRSAPELAQMLNEVGEAKVITPEELAKARAFRGAMDDLGDAVQEVGIQVGQQLVPVLTKLANIGTITIDIATNIGEVDKKTGGFLGELTHFAQNFANPMNTASEAYSFFLNLTKRGGDSTKAAASGVDALATSAEQMGAAIGPAGTSVGDFVRTAEQAADMNIQFGGSADAVAENLGHETDALAAANDALAAHTNAQLAAFDSTFAVTDANNAFVEALGKAEQKAQDSKTTAGDLAKAYDDETQAAVKAANAAVVHAQDLAKAEGSTLSAKDANKILIDTLSGLANMASGPTKTALQGLIAKLQETGAQKPTPTVTLNDQATGPVNAVQTKLDVIGRTRATAAIHADDQTAGPFASAQSRGNAWNGKVFTAVLQVARGATFGLIPGFARGGAVPGSPNKAQPAIVHGGEYVLSADVVDRIKKDRPSEGAGARPTALSTSGSGGTGTVVQITVNGAVDPYSTARQIQMILAKGTRGGFSTLAA